MNLAQLDLIDPARLPTFDAQFLVKCREWVCGSSELAPWIADITKFLGGYNINISDYAGYVGAAKYPGLTIGARANYCLAANSTYPCAEVDNSTKAIMYWSTIIDILCYRGLQDDTVYP